MSKLEKLKYRLIQTEQSQDPFKKEKVDIIKKQIVRILITNNYV